MTNLLNVPSPYADDKLVSLADWVEMKALLESDGNASREDLARVLERAHSMNNGAARGLAEDVFKELADRQASCIPLFGKETSMGVPV
ncbi:MAG: hypothetical protein O2968_11360 [Acidobacteria bacterium]|nr:hypothetical protein [Acidobacteriota bacterium]